MKEFKKVKAEVLNELNNANISDLKSSLIEKIIKKYEADQIELIKQRKKVPLPLNFVYPYTNIDNLKEGIETIINYNDFELNVFNAIQEFNQEHINGFYGDDVDYLIYFVCDKPNAANTLLGSNSKSLKTLLKLTAQYRADTICKGTYPIMTYIPPLKEEKEEESHKSFNGIIKSNIDRFARIKEDLHELGATQKGNELKALINDFLNKPDDFFLPKPKIKANVDTIRAFLRQLKISTDDISSYIARFKIEDNYSKPK
jgi:hypothetical protein